MILEFDLGNSSVKWRALSESGAAAAGVFVLPDIELAGLDSRAQVKSARGVSVVSAVQEQQLAQYLQAQFGIELHFVRVSAAAAGVTNSYADPSAMGADRWSAIVAAHHRVAGPIVVIDAGSALKIEVIDGRGRHLGGYIGAGLGMMRNALLAGTNGVRFNRQALTDSLAPGASTADCVAAGTLLALQGSVKLALEMAASAFEGGEFSVITCGGDALLLETQLNAAGVAWQSYPDLVLDGLALLGPAGA